MWLADQHAGSKLQKELERRGMPRLVLARRIYGISLDLVELYPVPAVIVFDPTPGHLLLSVVFVDYQCLD